MNPFSIKPSQPGKARSEFSFVRVAACFKVANYWRAVALINLSILLVTLFSASLQLNYFSISLEAKPAASTFNSTADGQARQSYGQLPLSFELNRGQSDRQVRFQSRGADYSLYFTSQEMVLDLPNLASDSQKSVTNEKSMTNPVDRPQVSSSRETSPSKAGTGISLRMKWLGGSDNPPVSGVDKLAGITNYLFGNDPSKWQINVPNYGKVAYQEVYPGIDLVFYGNQQQLEYDFTVKPHADPDIIRLSFEGATGLELNAAGELVAHTGDGDMVQPAPRLYQDFAGTRQEVQGRFKLLSPPDGGALPVVGFEVSQYDPNRSLVIDPTLVGYSTFLSGGNGADDGHGLALDSSGNAYVTGAAASTNFPVTAGAYKTTCGCNSQDAFITKLNSTGTALVYSTYLGGPDQDYATAIAVDSAGNAYITGYTLSANFPVTAGAYQTTLASGSDAFVTKLNATGTALVYSSYLGGNGDNDFSQAIAVDGSGNAYVTGTTTSTNFPTTAGAYQTTYTYGDSGAPFVTKFNAAGTALAYSTFLYGSSATTSIAVDSSGNAYVTGGTSSTSFPVTSGAFQATYGGSGDIFVTKLNATGTALVYSTYLGGANGDNARSLAIDSTGNAYIAGYTLSANFPVTAGVYQTTQKGTPIDVIVAKLNSTGTALIYSTYLGGAGTNVSYGIAIDSSGNAYVAGNTNSTDFPTTAGAFQTSYGGGINDVFLTKLNSGGTALLYSTFLGGNAQDTTAGVKVDGSGNAYLTGFTNSVNFPTTTGAFQTTKQNPSYAYSGYVTKLSTGSSKTCLVDNTADNAATSGTLRNALSQSPKCDIINFNFTTTTYFNIVGTALPAVPVGVTINGVCSGGKPAIVINSSGNITGIGLNLSGGDTVKCVEIAGFHGAGLKAAGGAGSNKLFQVKVGKTPYA